MLKIGHIEYLNSLPLTFYYEQNKDDKLEIIKDIPANLNKIILEKKLDLSPVSSIIYAQNYKDLKLLKNVSITATGSVKSIILVSKKPWEKLDKAHIILTSHSATSHCLCKILSKKYYHIDPQYQVKNISPKDDFLIEADAALFIGDHALFINNHQENSLYYYDLGKIWEEFTNLPMVYALWVCQKNIYKENKDLVLWANEIIKDGFVWGFNHLDSAINFSNALNTFSKEILDDYLHTIKWNLEEKEILGLLKFYEYANELHLIDSVPKLDFV